MSGEFISTEKFLKYAVIGYGNRGKSIITQMEGMRGIRARCIAVADTQRPDSTGRNRWGARFYRDYKKLLIAESPDFVVIASPETFHYEQAVAVLKKGIPVFLEKAVTSTWQDAVRLYRQVVKQRLPLFVGYNLRHFPAALETKRLIHSGRIGRVQSVVAHLNSGSDWSSHVFLRSFFRDASLSGDLVLIKLTHDTDCIQDMLKTHAAACIGTAGRIVWTARPRLVLAGKYRKGISSHRKGPTSHDFCSASGLFKNRTAFTFVFTTVGPDYERRYVFNGTKGQIETVLHTNRPGRPRAWVTLWPYGKKPRKIKVKCSGLPHMGADARLFQCFFKWLGKRGRGPSEPESILTGMLIPTAALESARTGRRVDCLGRMEKALLIK
jgi:predicted dehydrogenase